MAESIVLDDVTVANRALAKIGEGMIGSFEDESPRARQVVAIYDDVVEAAFCGYPWKWARQTLPLDASAAPIVNGWPNAFNFPALALNATPEALSTNPQLPGYTLRDFAIEQRTVYCRATALWGAFVCRLDPSLWPPLFRLAVITWLAAEFCVPISHDDKLAATMRVTAIGTPEEAGRGGLIGRAIGVDVAGSGVIATPLQSDPLTRARFEGQPWYGDF